MKIVAMKLCIVKAKTTGWIQKTRERHDIYIRRGDPLIVSTIQIFHRRLPARNTKHCNHLDDDCVEHGAEIFLSFRCWRVGLSVRCERTLEHVVEPLNSARIKQRCM